MKQKAHKNDNKAHGTNVSECRNDIMELSLAKEIEFI